MAFVDFIGTLMEILPTLENLWMTVGFQALLNLAMYLKWSNPK